MLYSLKHSVFLKTVENKFFFINNFFFTLIIGVYKFLNLPINYLLLYLFFFNLFFLKLQKDLLLKNMPILFLLSLESLYFLFLDKYEVSQLLVLFFFNFFIIFLIIKEIPFNYINGLKIGVYTIFILDVVIMLVKITTGNFLGHFGLLEIYYNYRLWPELRVNGLLQSPILSSILAIAVFLFSFYYKEKLFIFFSILFSGLSGSSRATFFILLFLIIYYVFLFFVKKEKIYTKKNLIALILFFSFFIIFFFKFFDSLTVSAKLRYLMFIEFKKCYLSTQICKKDLDQEKKKEGKHIIKMTNQNYYLIYQKIKKNDPLFSEILINEINALEISEIISSIEKAEYLTDNEKDILIHVIISSQSNLLNESSKSRNVEEEINNRVQTLSKAKIFENYYLTSIINDGFFSIIFRTLLILYIFTIVLKNFITYKYKNIFSFTLIISIFFSNFIDTIVFSYFFVIYIWIFLFFLINQKDNFQLK